MTRVLVFTTEIAPFPGLPTVGGGLRGWTLARGLETAGFDVTLLFPQQPLAGLGPEYDPATIAAALPHTFDWHDPLKEVEERRPDVVVCCSWLMASKLTACPVPLAVDVAGPVLLEYLYQRLEKGQELAQFKPQGLGAADFVTCAGERQRAYFYAWLILAGFDQAALAERVATIPISAAPRPAAAPPLIPPANDEPTLLFAGVALPWQDPVVPLRATLAALDRAGRGRLEVSVMEHPVHSQGATWVGWLRDQARDNPRVILHPNRLWPYEELLDRYRRADLAFDLFARNPERELAFNTRTVDYLACGLPPLYSDYAELAPLIARYDAGIVVDPHDEAAVTTAVAAALGDREGLAARRAAARRLVDERLTWDRTIAPLARWCANPTRRQAGGLGESFLLNHLQRQLHEAEGERDRALRLAEERETYARRVEAAWAEQGAQLRQLDAALLDWQRHPWQRAAVQALGAARRRHAQARGAAPHEQREGGGP